MFILPLLLLSFTKDYELHYEFVYDPERPYSMFGEYTEVQHSTYSKICKAEHERMFAKRLRAEINCRTGVMRVISSEGKVIHRQQLTQEQMAFYGIDPHTENYPWNSPYAYCSANPINRKDPNGMDDYGVDREGYTFVIKETEDKYDRLVAGVRNKMGKDGNYKGVRLDEEGNYKNNTLEIHKNVMKSKYQNEYGDRYTFFDKQDATDYFEFMANNTDVEWAQYGLESMSGTQYNYVTTSHEIYSEVMSSKELQKQIYNKDCILNYHIHSHPFDFYATAKQNQDGSVQDIMFKNSIQKRTNGGVEFYTYSRFKYNPY